MPLILVGFGIVLLLAGLRNKVPQLAELLHNDFTGRDSFLIWLGVFSIIYFIGKIDKSGGIAKGFSILVIAVIMLTKGRGFFDMLNSQLKQISNG